MFNFSKITRLVLDFVLTLYIILAGSLINPQVKLGLSATDNQARFEIQAEGGATSPPPGAVVIRRWPGESFIF